jgi:hypothetical protein
MSVASKIGFPTGTGLNVSLPTAQRGSTVRNKGDPELVAAVSRGEIAVSAAADFVQQTSPTERTQLIEQHGSPAAAIKAAKTAANGKHDPANKEGITALKTKLVESNRVRKQSGEICLKLTRENESMRVTLNYLQEQGATEPQFDPSTEIAPPEVLAENILYAIGGVNENASIFKPRRHVDNGRIWLCDELVDKPVNEADRTEQIGRVVALHRRDRAIDPEVQSA